MEIRELHGDAGPINPVPMMSNLDLTEAEREALRLVAESGSYQFSHGHYIGLLVRGYAELHRNRYGQERVRLTPAGRALVEKMEGEHG